MPHYINADLSHSFARVSIEEAYNEDRLVDWLDEDEVGFLPTSEQEQAARDAAGYVLCIEPDTTDDGTVIPEWAFE